MSYRRTFMADVRRQLAAETESHAIWRIRLYAACLSILFGMVGLSGFLSMALGNVSWAAAPGCLVMLAGGVLAIGVLPNRNIASSRRLGLLAAGCTVVGFVEFFLVTQLS
ncbi:hypothetical protein HC028_03380 [Planosporangium flavigriseum]|uniref:Uncharacterized protein n=1 Tax=Planosporangium flavigriseum TaxID=373681 RepID=A0A8J3LJ43_9ACTN|nr:hypothetical protein [Planosporangium flavigriseum]NJC63557.1 hypothetical protein [Planosporangium flavigriseum]GIG72254.1 hypothetical protein Pfl04_06580 [Planosporangium flavigriseum]